MIPTPRNETSVNRLTRAGGLASDIASSVIEHFLVSTTYVDLIAIESNRNFGRLITLPWFRVAPGAESSHAACGSSSAIFTDPPFEAGVSVGNGLLPPAFREAELSYVSRRLGILS